MEDPEEQCAEAEVHGAEQDEEHPEAGVDVPVRRRPVRVHGQCRVCLVGKGVAVEVGLLVSVREPIAAPLAVALDRWIPPDRRRNPPDLAA